MEQCKRQFQDLEYALIEYVERYGPTDTAKQALMQPLHLRGHSDSKDLKSSEWLNISFRWGLAVSG